MRISSSNDNRLFPVKSIHYGYGLTHISVKSHWNITGYSGRIWLYLYPLCFVPNTFVALILSLLCSVLLRLLKILSSSIHLFQGNPFSPIYLCLIISFESFYFCFYFCVWFLWFFWALEEEFMMIDELWGIYACRYARINMELFSLVLVIDVKGKICWIFGSNIWIEGYVMFAHVMLSVWIML